MYQPSYWIVPETIPLTSSLPLRTVLGNFYCACVARRVLQVILIAPDKYTYKIPRERNFGTLFETSKAFVASLSPACYTSPLQHVSLVSLKQYICSESVCFYWFGCLVRVWTYLFGNLLLPLELELSYWQSDISYLCCVIWIYWVCIVGTEDGISIILHLK